MVFIADVSKSMGDEILEKLYKKMQTRKKVIVLNSLEKSEFTS